MTNDEINRAVAVALGWIPMDAMGSGWFQSGTTVKAPPHWQFTTDPAAADLVRIEIERRGWMLTRIDYKSERSLPAYPNQHRAQILTGNWKYGDDGLWGASDDSPCLALCLAFLAAVEAEKEVSK